MLALVIVLFVPSVSTAATAAESGEKSISVGSKAFPESWILGEALVSLARAKGPAVHKRNLGGTELVWQALTSGSIDAYVEYTGTIAQVILKNEDAPTHETLRAALEKSGVGMSAPIGFDDGYAIATMRKTAERERIGSLSDLARHASLRAAFTHEFLGRKDGYPGLAARYGLHLETRGIEHELGYVALANGQADVMDIYTTDPQIERMDLVLLDDDRAFFTRYEAVLLYRLDLRDRAPLSLSAMDRLVGAVDERRMRHANALVAGGTQSPEQAAAWLLGDALGAAAPAPTGQPSRLGSIAWATGRHLELVFVSLLFAILLGVPLGVLARRSPALATVTLSAASILQTIPSLALLAFLIPLFGIGASPALAALLVYGLLPIVRNTHAGLSSIPASLLEAAEAIGLSPRERLVHVSLPLASPMILAGIKTSAVISVGTATLAALVGAGGLGDAILEGIALRNNARILEGAVPVAVLALGVQWAFGLLDRVLVPRGLREP
jgi:osmoprotectant transport system permease protein